MKKTIILAALALVVAGCSKEQKNEVKSNGLPKAEAATKGGAAQLPIAYVEVDSLATQYQFCIEKQEELTAKQKNYAAQLEKEGRTFESAANSFQEKLQSGKFASEQEARNAQAALQKQQQAIQQHESQYSDAMAEASAAYQKDLRERLDKFLKAYNKDGRYSLILTNSEAAINVLYAAPGMDITKDVIDGLNKEYKKK